MPPRLQDSGRSGRLQQARSRKGPGRFGKQPLITDACALSLGPPCLSPSSCLSRALSASLRTCLTLTAPLVFLSFRPLLSTLGPASSFLSAETPGEARWPGRVRPEQGAPPAPVREVQGAGLLLPARAMTRPPAGPRRPPASQRRRHPPARPLCARGRPRRLTGLGGGLLAHVC